MQNYSTNMESNMEGPQKINMDLLYNRNFMLVIYVKEIKTGF